MTKLQSGKVLTRETNAHIHGQPVIARMGPYSMSIGPKGMPSHRYEIAWASIYEHAAELQARRVRAERKARRAR